MPLRARRRVRRDVPVRRARRRSRSLADARRQPEQQGASPIGARRARPIHAAPRRTTRIAEASPSRGRRPATSATASSATRRRTSSPRTASRNGARCGASSWTTRSGCARRPAASTRPLAYDAARSARELPQRLRLDRLRAHAGGARDGRRSTTRQQLNTVGGYIDASSVYGDSAERLEWLRRYGDEGDNGASFPPRRLPPARRRPRRRGDAPAMALDRAPAREPEPGEGGRRPAREREHRAHRHPHAVRARAQPDRRRAAGSLSDEERFQIARRVVGAEQQYITYEEFLPALGRRALGLRRLRPGRERVDHERVRRGRVPGPQHGPRGARAERAGGHLLRRGARGVRGAGHRGRARGRRWWCSSCR